MVFLPMIFTCGKQRSRNIHVVVQLILMSHEYHFTLLASQEIQGLFEIFLSRCQKRNCLVAVFSCYLGQF